MKLFIYEKAVKCQLKRFILKLKISPHLSVFCEKFPNWILTDFEPCVVKLFSCNLKMFHLKSNFNLEMIWDYRIPVFRSENSETEFSFAKSAKLFYPTLICITIFESESNSDFIN